MFIHIPDLILSALHRLTHLMLETVCEVGTIISEKSESVSCSAVSDSL